VVTARATGHPVEDRPVDLRVEDHPNPVGELRRLVEMRRAYGRADAGDQLAAAGELDAALVEYEAAHRSQPDNHELAFWHGVALAASGRKDEAAPMLRQAFDAHAGWVELLKRLPAAGLFPDDGELIARLAGTRAVSEPARPTESPPPAAPPPSPGASGETPARIPPSPGPPPS
jgi:tetratricopeptide (TPR) repeat protein